MKSKIYTLVLFLLVMILSACGMLNSFRRDPLDGTSWELVAIGESNPVKGSHITISFDNGHVSGNSGCNHYGGDYKVRENRIEFGILETTLMACADPAMMEQESRFTRLLGEAGEFEIVGGQLQMFGTEGEELNFIPTQTPNP